MTDRKAILYISCSLDGYIAKPGDDLGFLNMVRKEGEDYGYNEFIRTVDTVIAGRRTYDWVLEQGYEFPHKKERTYIITSHEQPEKDNLTFFGGDLKELVRKLKEQDGKNIFCVGGAEIVNQLLAGKSLDEIIISFIPVLVGNGTRLFEDERPEQKLELLSTRTFDSGLVQLRYKMKTEV
ncbi:MAG: dihydrofolate reductase family protein [Fibrobacterota bacterium]